MRLHAGKDLAPLQPDRFPVFQPGNGKAEQAVAGLLGNIDRQQDHAGAGNGSQPKRTRFRRDPHALSPRYCAVHSNIQIANQNIMNWAA
ncbi:hypothetical protein ACFS32_12500 [Novosphingobium pokkalii]|uniref:hypothetical protein n=1 Tax=Novosphingobium pokkalii TaxID=1770194 RepID=UPI0036401FAC